MSPGAVIAGCQNQAAFLVFAHEFKSESGGSNLNEFQERLQAEGCTGGFPLDDVLTMICVGK